MARKPHDNDREIKALADRRKELAAQRKTRLGEVLQRTGADGALDFDQIAGLVRDALERLARDPGLGEGWRSKGQEFFRRGRGGIPGGAAPGALHDAGSANGTGDAAGKDRAPARPRSPAPPPAAELPLDPQG